METLRKEGISNEKVLKAIEHLPRHLFVPAALYPFAYENRALPIGRGQTISQPYTVAFMLEKLDINRDKLRVLEIGTGSGYQTALVAYLGCEVYSLERDRELFLRAKKVLRHVLDEGAIRRVHLYWRDGFEGLPRHSPYHRIVVSAAVGTVPSVWLEELDVGGVLVCPVVLAGFQRMLIVGRPAAEVYTFRQEGYFRFVEAKPGVE